MTNERKKVRETLIFLALFTTAYSLYESYRAHIYFHADGYVINFIIPFAFGIVFTILLCALRALEYNKLKNVADNLSAIIKIKIISVFVFVIIIGAFGVIYTSFGYSGASGITRKLPIDTLLIALGISLVIFVAFVIIAEIADNKIKSSNKGKFE